MIDMVEAVARSGGPVKSQQIGEPELSVAERRQELLRQYKGRPLVFLERYHVRVNTTQPRSQLKSSCNTVCMEVILIPSLVLSCFGHILLKLNGIGPVLLFHSFISFIYLFKCHLVSHSGSTPLVVPTKWPLKKMTICT